MLIPAGDTSVPVMLNELRSVLQHMNTLLPLPSAGSDALHFNAKEGIFFILQWLTEGTPNILIIKKWEISCFSLSTSELWMSSLGVNLEIKFFSGWSWLLHKFLLPLNKIPNTPSFAVKDTMTYIFLWGVINVWIQRNNVLCSSLNMRICISLCLSHH